MQHVIRWLLTAVLLYFVRQETGWGTTIFAMLVFINSELNWLLWRKLTRVVGRSL